MNMIKRILLAAAALALVSYAAICIYLWHTQRQKIFEPTAVLQTNPARLGIAYEEVLIPSGSGSERGELYGWWIPAGKADAPTILFLHGNDKNVSHVHDVATAARMHNQGYNLLLIDYRGYGKSTGGEPSEAKVYEDAEAAWNYLIKQRSRSPQRTFIYGHSLGGAIAIDLAVHHPEAAGVITESTFTRMVDMAKREYAYLPVDPLLNQRFDTLDKVSQLKIPVLFIHGTWDRKIPYQMSEQLFKQAPQPKYLKLIESGEHDNSGVMGMVEYLDAFNTFIRKYAH
jgi:pimeloyl-ACP methyl ester carboxylesterase